MIYFYLVAITFFTIAGVIIVYMTIHLRIVNLRRGKYRKWKNRADSIIRDVIFSEVAEDAVEVVPIDKHTQILLGEVRFRKLLTKELLLAKKNMTGSTGIMLKKFSRQLKLEQFILQDLASHEWHIKAKAIQAIGIMGFNEFLLKVFRLTNNKNELVRMEAQITVVKLTGYKGLRFLDVVSTQINDWQQIKLLNELSLLPAVNFQGIDKWLKSTNVSVVVFALKLVRTFHRFELYDKIVESLDHPIEQIRAHAYLAIEKIYTDSSAELILNNYEQETSSNRTIIIKVIQSIGSENDVSRLIGLIKDAETEQQRTIVRTIANISPTGIIQLRQLPEAEKEPLNLIINQIEGELSA